MVVDAPPRALTYEDLEQFTDRRHRYEILQGELIVSAAPTPLHVMVATVISEIVSAHVRRNRLGFFYGSPVNVRISRHDIVEPDLCFVSSKRLEIVGEKFIDGAPDLVIEVLSPSTQSYDRRRKMALYAGGGVREYWLVDPIRRSVHILIFTDGIASESHFATGIIESFVLHALDLKIDEIFPAQS
jgi:Uma2 family endonuclease